MKIDTRRRLDMATRVRDFSRARPDTNPGSTTAVDRLTDRIARAEVLAQQQLAGRQAVTGAIATREKLREDITGLIVLLAGLARQAAREAPELAPGIGRPERGASVQSFLTRGRVAAASAANHRELLVRYGMPETYPDDLGAMLDRFEAAMNDKHAARSAHVGAGAELEAASAEIMQLVRQLDALNRFRFRNDAESLGAWRSARNVAWPAGERVKEPPEGDVRPAA